MNSLGLTVIPLAFGVLLTASPSLWAWLEPRCGIVLRWCAWVGRYSYSIYLWHIIVRDAGKFTLIHSPMSASATTILYLAASLGVGIGMASLIEMPVLRLRDRFFPSRSS
jgi:peptidoglycan/LPS O-acetylase OafA/YrhL